MGRRPKTRYGSVIYVLLVAVTCWLAWSAPFVVHAQEKDRTNDVTEDAKDMSGARTRSKPGFLVAPIPVSEPVLGTGLAIAGMMFYQLPNAGPHGSHAGLVIGATSNGSWLVGGMNSMKLRNDSLRVNTTIAYGHFNEKYFGLDGSLDPGIDYSQDRFLFELAPRVRLRGGNWFVGLEYRFENTETTTDVEVPDEETGKPAPISGSRRVGGIMAVAAYDNRDNLYSATAGRLLEFKVGTYQPWLGSSDRFSKGWFELRQFWAAKEGSFILGARVRSELVSGDEAPFFEQPDIGLRGYARGQLRDDVTLWGEVEARYDLFWKIGVAAFGGMGWAADNYSGMFDSKTRWAGGLGLRYNLRPQDRLKLGVDLAWAVNGAPAFYLRVGESF
jgi:outer membrane protein assembly factor BamA